MAGSRGRLAWLAFGVLLFLAAAAWPRLRPAHAPAAAPTPEPAVVLRLKDAGAIVTLRADGSITGLDVYPAELQQAVARALDSDRLETPDLGELVAPVVQEMSERRAGELFGPTQPQGVVVESDVPVFHWQTLPDATGYQVGVFDMAHEPVAQSPTVNGGEWQPASPLPRGRTYVWQVTALLKGRKRVAPAPPAPEVRFRVLEAAAASALESARATGGPRVALAVLYARHGLLEAAAAELHTLAQANPDVTRLRELIVTLQPTSLD